MNINPILLLLLVLLIVAVLLRAGGLRGLSARLTRRGQRGQRTQPHPRADTRRQPILPLAEDPYSPRRLSTSLVQRRVTTTRRMTGPASPRRRMLDLWGSRGRSGQLVMLGIALMALLVVFQLFPSGSTAPRSEHLAIAISPFVGPDGSDDGSGAAIANDLVNSLASDPQFRLKQPVSLTALRDPISGAQAAYELALAEGFDVVIWGVAERGAEANSRDLRPLLLYAPRRGLPLERWSTLRERFVIPVVSELSLGAPINGLAVLSPLIDTLELYTQGRQIDETIGLLTSVLDGYQGVISPVLPATLRASLRWAQGDLSAAELDARRAIEAASDDPVLWNNLGVVLLARGDLPAAEESFARSLTLAQERGVSLPAAHFNRGLAAQNNPDPARALEEFRRAAELLPGRPALLVPLATLQRRSGSFGDARATINQALQLAPNDPDALLESGRLRFAEMLGAGNPIEWALEDANSLPLERLTSARGEIERAATLYEQQIDSHRGVALGADAQSRLETGRLYEALARGLDPLLSESRYWQGLALIEEGRAALRQDKGFLESLWDTIQGEVSPLDLGRQQMEAFNTRTGSYDSRYQLGRALKIGGLRKQADDQFLAAIGQEPGRPEGYFGRASLLAQDRASEERNAQLRELLGQAIAADQRYYPARYMLLQLELDSGSWEAALQHLDWLNAAWPGDTGVAISRGMVLRQLGRYPEAELQLIELANQGNSQAMVELALVYRAAGYNPAAEDVLRRVLAQNPNQPLASFELGKLLHEQGREAEAAESLERAVSASPGLLEAHLLLGQLYNGPLNQPQKAIEHYQRAIDSGGSNPRDYETLGRLFLRAGVPQEAAKALERALALEPGVPEVHHLLASAYLQLGQYEQARQHEQAALERAPEGRYPDALAGIGDSYRFEGRFEEAVGAYTRALEQDPDLIAVYIGLGRMAADQQQLQVAIGHYQQALERDPSNAEAHYWLGTAYLEGGNNESAQAAFQRAAELNPEQVEAYYGNARASLALGDIEEAEKLLGEALRRRPNYAEALLARGKLLEQRGQFDQALALYGQAAQSNPRMAEPLYLQGLIQMRASNFAQAIAALETAVQRQGHYPEAHYWLGRAYRSEGRLEDALARFTTALEQRPELLEARYFLASSEAELGHREQAIAAYQQVIDLAPADHPLRSESIQALERLR